jgi:hypothetical protein
MVSYFKELLSTLKRIEQHLSTLSSCVRKSDLRYGDRYSISTKHWNDNR